MAATHHTRKHQAAVAAMKARARYQPCWSCGKTLDALAPKGHPQHMTLGHRIDVDAGGDPYDPANHGPQCAPCNYSAGAHRTNAKRRGDTGLELTTSPDWT